MVRSIGAVGVAAAAVAALSMPLRPALAWGLEGHRTIALIADRVLQQSDPAARAKVQAILATDKGNKLTKNDIASEATWADALRQKSAEARDATEAWHSTRFKPGNPDLAAACFSHTPLPEGYPASHGPRENCSVDKIAQFSAELRDADTSAGERLAALQFVLNLVGDLNDPLHAIDRGDQGGDCVALQIGSKPPVRLSDYWQGTLVGEVVGSNPASGAARLAAAPAEAQKWAEGNPEAWAQESYEIAKSVTYSFASAAPVGKHTFPPRKGESATCASIDLYRVGEDYETRALAAVKQQLAKAGVRLARVLRDNVK